MQVDEAQGQGMRCRWMGLRARACGDAVLVGHHIFSTCLVRHRVIGWQFEYPPLPFLGPSTGRESEDGMALTLSTSSHADSHAYTPYTTRY